MTLSLTLQKRRKNSRAPISRLPPEILSLIFSNIRDSHLAALIEGFCLPANDVGSELWKGFTHVCHSWREIALCTPTLWTRVVSSPNNNKWTQEMLLRSKRCLLTSIVKGCLDSCDSTNGRKELIEQLGQCRTLSMQGVPCHDLHKYWSSKVYAPQLEYLLLQVNEEDTSSEIPFILSDSHLHAPSLRSLEIENCGVDWKSGFLTSSLTHLGLEGLPIDSLLECSELIKVLASMPFLEDVYLNYDYIRDEDVDMIPLSGNNSNYLYWPHLQCLDITDDVVKIARFLSNISLPRLSKLHLRTCELVHEARPYIPLVLDWLSNHFKQPAGASHLAPQNCIRSFILQALDDEVTMQGYNEVFHIEQEGLEIDAQFQFNFLDLGNEDLRLFGATLMNTILPRLPINSIVSLDVSIPGFYLPASCWLTTFSSIPTLESIYLCASRATPFFHALCPESGDDKSLPFPALKTIGLDTDIFPIDYLPIVEVLRQRIERGRRLEKFVFFTPHSIPPYHLLSQLIELIPRVGIYRGPVPAADKE